MSANKYLIATMALIRDTFREAFARKIFWGFFGCSTALILFFIFIMRIDVVQGAVATMTIFGKEAHPNQNVNLLVRQVHGGIAAFLYTVGMFLAVFASAGLIPTIFEPGRIELLLSKPVKRYHILLGRYIGNLLVVGFNVFYLVLAIYLIFGIKTGVWNTNFVMSAFMTMFMFAVLLTVVLLIGVLVESAAVAIMVTFALMLISPILAQKSTIERLLSAEWSRDILRGLYYALPKFFDGGRILRELVIGGPIESWMPIWSTALFGIVILSAGLYSFARRDF